MLKLWIGLTSIIIGIFCKTVFAADETPAQINQQIDAINYALSLEKNKITELKISQQHSNQALTEQRATLSTQIQNAYQLRQSQTPAMIFSSQNPETIARFLTYYRYLNQDRSHLIKNIKLTLDQINQQLADIATHQQKLNALLHEKQNQIALLGNPKTKTVTALEIATDGKIEPSISHQPFKQLRGKLAWPVNGAVLRHFGSSLEVGQERFPGILIKAPNGTPVHSIYQGKIMFANWLRGFGLLVIVNHGNGFMSLYAHNKALFAKTGDTVKTGTVIAATGASGNYSSPGLYFEIRQNGSPVNPNRWLATV